MDAPVRIRLRDGRHLGYSEFGDPHGAPVINCHGGLMCRLDVAPADGPAKELGIRIVSPDRPGVASSDPKPGRTTLDWVQDVQDLADELGLDRFSVMGWSMGGQYALACSHGLAGRVSRTAVLAGAVPLDDAASFAELNSMDRRLTRLSQRHPKMARAVFETLGEVAEKTPEVWLHLTARESVPEDAEAIHRQPPPGIAAASAPALKASGGMVEEYLAWVRPWGFRPEDVPGAVAIWQGDHDDLVPPLWAQSLAKRIPHASLHMAPGEGHLFPYDLYPEILRDLTG